MNSGKTIFSQLMDFLPSYEFRRCVERYDGNYRIESFSCWNQYLRMAFAQLTYRESLIDIQTCLRSAPQKLCHLGIRGTVSCNTLAHANQVRDWRIYADFKWIKQHLRIKAFYGTSENAVKTQIWIAVSCMCSLPSSKAASLGPKSLHNSTDSERYPFRKNTVVTSTFQYRLQRSSGGAR